MMYGLAAQNMETLEAQRHAAYEDMKARAKVGGADEGSPAYWAWRDEQGRARTSLGIDGKTRFRNLQGRVRVGDIFGRLTVVKLLPGASKDHGHQQAEVECVCSFDRLVVRVADLRYGHTTACGKHRKEALDVRGWIAEGIVAENKRKADWDAEFDSFATPSARKPKSNQQKALTDGDLSMVFRAQDERAGDAADLWLRGNDPERGRVRSEPAITEADWGPKQEPLSKGQQLVSLSPEAATALNWKPTPRIPWTPQPAGLQITVSTNRPDQSQYRRIT